MDLSDNKMRGFVTRCGGLGRADMVKHEEVQGRLDNVPKPACSASVKYDKLRKVG